MTNQPRGEAMNIVKIQARAEQIVEATIALEELDNDRLDLEYKIRKLNKEIADLLAGKTLPHK